MTENRQDWREPIVLQPIGVVREGRRSTEDDYWGGSVCRIELDAERFGPGALAALDEFSHVLVVFHFHRVPAGSEETGARHPRGQEEWPLAGIFAQRAKRRPNRLGVTTCRIVRVDGTTLEVEGLDALEGTPVVDLKPHLAEFEPRGEVHQPDWSRELMADYFTDITQQP